MCAIIGSFDKVTLAELYKLNSYRGELSYSVCSFKQNGKLDVGVLMQGEGKMPDTLIFRYPSETGDFYIAHSQAPTTETKNIHPAANDAALLWHNGIIKQKTISEGTWDTAWLLEQILDYGWSVLSRIDGTFACVMYNENSLYVFRNEISPLFIDDNLNISSTRFNGGESLEPNKVFKLDLIKKKKYIEAEFETKENPYYIPEL